MLPTIGIYTRELLRPQEIYAFLTEIGADIRQDHVYAGEWRRPSMCLWIGIHGDYPVYYVHAYDLHEHPAVTAALGGPPRTMLNIDMTKGPETVQFAVEFVLLFGERWPCIVSGEHGYMYTLAEVRALQQQQVDMFY